MVRNRNSKKVAFFIIVILYLTLQISVNAQDLPYDNLHPAVSPDGARIVFDSTRDNDWEIYVMNIDGSNPVRLTYSPGRDAHPFWSPDGARIVFQSPRDHEKPFEVEIYSVNADGSDLKRLTQQPGFTGVPAWSPDGSRIVFQSTKQIRVDSWDIFMMDADGANLKRLTADDANNQVPNWSPEGDRIVFHSDKTGKNQIYIMTLDGLQVQRLTHSDYNDQSATWSPDGSKIAFKSDRSGSREIYLMNADGSGQKQLTEGINANGLPSWTPDGKRIVFQSGKSGNSEIYAINVDGTKLTRLTYPPEGVLNFPEIIITEGVEKGVETYRQERRKAPGKILFHESSMNRLGYKFLNQNRFKEAIQILKLVVDSFPESANAYDSLGEAYMKAGHQKLAIKNYEKSLALNPDNANAVEMLNKLKQR